jgi:hypothetical protein
MLCLAFLQPESALLSFSTRHETVYLLCLFLALADHKWGCGID